jgi:hypothetical protein
MNYELFLMAVVRGLMIVASPFLEKLLTEEVSSNMVSDKNVVASCYRL